MDPKSPLVQTMMWAGLIMLAGHAGWFVYDLFVAGAQVAAQPEPAAVTAEPAIAPADEQAEEAPQSDFPWQSVPPEESALEYRREQARIAQENCRPRRGAGGFTKRLSRIYCSSEPEASQADDVDAAHDVQARCEEPEKKKRSAFNKVVLAVPRAIAWPFRRHQSEPDCAPQIRTGPFGRH